MRRRKHGNGSDQGLDRAEVDIARRQRPRLIGRTRQSQGSDGVFQRQIEELGLARASRGEVLLIAADSALHLIVQARRDHDHLARIKQAGVDDRLRQHVEPPHLLDGITAQGRVIGVDEQFTGHGQVVIPGAHAGFGFVGRLGVFDLDGDKDLAAVVQSQGDKGVERRGVISEGRVGAELDAHGVVGFSRAFRQRGVVRPQGLYGTDAEMAAGTRSAGRLGLGS